MSINGRVPNLGTDGYIYDTWRMCGRVTLLSCHDGIEFMYTFYT